MSLEGWVCEVESEKLSLGKLGLEKESGKLSPEKCMVVGTPPTKIRKRGPYPAGCLLGSLVFPPPCPVVTFPWGRDSSSVWVGGNGSGGWSVQFLYLRLR